MGEIECVFIESVIEIFGVEGKILLCCLWMVYYVCLGVVKCLICRENIVSKL